MSLFKQIAILVSTVFTLLFIVILTISFSVIKQSAKKSLYENAQNSASSLSLSMTNSGVDESSIKTLINASFDNGNYEKIVFKDMQNSILYERIKHEHEHEKEIPLWFLNLIDIKEIGAKVNISSGWSVVGSLEVFNDRALLYTPLYNIFKGLIVTLSITFFVLLIILAALVHLMLKPLLIVERQALAVMKNEFIIEKRIPFTLEFKSLTVSINGMIKKIQAIFENANAALKQNKELLYFDATTKLYNRHYFSLKASEYILEQGSFSKGLVIVLGVSRVELLNKLIGYQKTDAFFKDVASILNSSFDNLSGSLIARLNGTEFVALIPCIHPNQYQDVIESFSKEVKELFGALNVAEGRVDLTLGFCEYSDVQNIGKLFSKIDYTLSHAKISGSQNYLDLDKESVDMGKEQWREILKTALAENSFELFYTDIVNQKNSSVVYKEMNFYLKTKDREYKYSEFIASVVELRMLANVYTSVIKKVLIDEDEHAPVIIYLPFHLIECTESYTFFKDMLQTLNQKTDKTIIFEIAEDSIIKRYSCSTQMIKLIRSFGYEFAVSNFIASSDDYTFLKELKPQYIKASKNFILDSQQNIGLIKIIMESIGLDIVVVDVENEEEVQELKKLNLFTLKMS